MSLFSEGLHSNCLLISQVSANSDGNSETNGPPGQYWVQCGLPSSVQKSPPLYCSVESADAYELSAALITKSGTSSSAAFVAGAAALIRQYLADGWYPRGVKNESNTNYQDPSAALLKALIINSARSTGGTVVKYSFEAPQTTCASCPAWVEPAPNVSIIQLQSSFVYSNPPATPNIYEGFGRPELSNILWIANAENSSYSLYLKQNKFFSSGIMHTYTFLIANSPKKASFGLQLKITLCYTDPPGIPGSNYLLVNDLDLVVQKMVTSVVWNVNLAQEVTVNSFASTYGNSNGGVPDRANTVEEVILFAGENEQDIVNVTIVVVSYRLASSYLKEFGSQSYALVVTGSLMTRIHFWQTIRNTVLAVAGEEPSNSVTVDSGVKKAFGLIDYLNVGYFTAEDIWVRWKQIGLPSQDQILADNLEEEADTDSNGIVDLEEFAEIVYLLRHNSMQARDPIFQSVPADPAFLGVNLTQYSVLSKSWSGSLQPQHALNCCAALLAFLLQILSIFCLHQTHES